MRFSSVLLAASIAVPAFAQELPVFDAQQAMNVIATLNGKVLVRNNGASFACEINDIGDAVIVENCAPVVTSDTYDRYRRAVGDRAAIAADAAAEAEAEAEANSQIEGRHWNIDGVGPVGEQQLVDLAVAFFEARGCQVSIKDTKAVEDDLLKFMFAGMGLAAEQPKPNRDVLYKAIDAVFETLMVERMVLIDSDAMTASLAGCNR